MKSPLQSRSATNAPSTETSKSFCRSSEQLALALDKEHTLPGSLNDSFVIRGVLVDAIRRSGKTRETIADEMSYLVGRDITVRMLNGFTAENEDYKFPSELDRAFCRVTGDNRLLSCRAEQAGLHVITEDERLLMELGRQYLLRNQADEQIALLQRRMHGRVA